MVAVAETDDAVDANQLPSSVPEDVVRSPASTLVASMVAKARWPASIDAAAVRT